MEFSGAHRAAITARRAHKAPPTEAIDLTADPVKGTIELAVTPPEDAGEPVAVAAPLLTGKGAELEATVAGAALLETTAAELDATGAAEVVATAAVEAGAAAVVEAGAAAAVAAHYG